MALISLSHIKKLTLNDPQLTRDLISVFISENSHTLQKLGEEYGKKNWSELQKAAHKLKSSLALVGLEKHRAMAEKLENIAGADLSKTKELVDELSGVLEQAIYEMGEKLRTICIH